MAQGGSGTLSGMPLSYAIPLVQAMFPQGLANGIDRDAMWQHFMHLVDSGMLEFGRYLTGPSQPGQGVNPNQSSNATFYRNLLSTMNEVARQKLVGTTTQEKRDDMFVVQIPLPAGNMKPEDMKITMKDRVMTVEVKKEELSEDGTFRHYQEYSKKISIPDGVKVEEIKSVLQPDGILRVEAPLPRPEVADQTKPTEIPIDIHME